MCVDMDTWLSPGQSPFEWEPPRVAFEWELPLSLGAGGVRAALVRASRLLRRHTPQRQVGPR